MKYRSTVTDPGTGAETPASPRKLMMAIWLDRLMEWRFGILLSVILGTCLLKFFVGIPQWELNDAAGAPEQRGIATVLDRTVITRKQGPDFKITFKVGDRLSEKTVYDAHDWNLTEVGAKVAVQYRIGKSGRLYVDRWELPRQ